MSRAAKNKGSFSAAVRVYDASRETRLAQWAENFERSRQRAQQASDEIGILRRKRAAKGGKP